MNCPHCGAVDACVDFEGVHRHQCGSASFGEGGMTISMGCLSRQISQLKAELAQSVRRDDSRLTEIASELERGSNMALDNMEGEQGEDFIAWEQVHRYFANQRDKLQSIISGK